MRGKEALKSSEKVKVGYQDGPGRCSIGRVSGPLWNKSANKGITTKEKKEY